MSSAIDILKNHSEWAYLITFLWTALEGETFLIVAALWAERGYFNLNISGLFVAAWLGSFCGDQVFFLLGRYFSTHILTHMPKLQPKLEKVLGWLEKHATAFILAYRFMYGVRNISGIAVGMSHLPWRRFWKLNLCAAFIWSFCFCAVGYIFGGVVGHFGHHKEDIVNNGVRGIMLATLGLFMLVLLIRMVVVRIHRRSTARGRAAGN